MTRLCLWGLLVMVVGCWHGAPPPAHEAPRISFVARVSALHELRTGTAALDARLAAARQRMDGLASEAERTAIGEDLDELEQDITHLARLASNARERFEDPALVGFVVRELSRAIVELDTLRIELPHAKTLAEREAFEQLKKQMEGKLDVDHRRIRVFRRDQLPLDELP